MKKISIILSMCIVAIVAVAQQKADIKISYVCHEDHLKTDAKAYTAEYHMTLLANSTESKFYNQRCEYMDSLRTTASGRVIYREIFNNMASKYVETGVLDDSALPKKKMYIFKSRNDSTLSFYDTNGSSHSHFYVEPLSEMQWHVGDSVKTILGYECIVAETDFRGRHWTVWFTTEIPVQDGPWKLCGLPGLILEAVDSTGQHSFIADGIEESNVCMTLPYDVKDYERVSRIEMLAAQRKFLLKGDSMTRMLVQNTPDGSKIDMSDIDINDNPDLHIDFLETDYH